MSKKEFNELKGILEVYTNIEGNKFYCVDKFGNAFTIEVYEEL